MKKPTWRNFKDARKFVQSLGLKSNKEWREFCKSDEKPDNIPVKPQDRYKNKGWVDWGDFLGTGTIAPQNKKHRTFENARKYVQLEKIPTQKKWKEYCASDKKPEDIPSNPNLVYKNKGWNGYPDWLGTNYIPNQERKYRSFSNARTFARNLELDSRTEWDNYCKSGKKPDDIPANPNIIYKKEWGGVGDWLGTGTIANRDRVYLSFEKARKIICALDPKIISKTEWANYCKSGKRPTNIPYSPDKTYKNKGWKGYPDWLGTGTIANRDRVYLSFEKARDFVRLLKLKNEHEWREYYTSGQLPNNIPTAPAVVYKDKGWKGLGDWLGTGTIANRDKIFLSAKEAKPVLQKLFKEYGIKNLKDWKKFAKTHSKLLEELHFPSDFLAVYSKARYYRSLKN